ncbi:unnamed protein product [Phytomonas sp. EM1]|nr:unnamed protein product [Phytomonas sp. EM1]|eukprot:CCW59883.1 unnamed protein product [Phytomonas sp. isolate EM1]
MNDHHNCTYVLKDETHCDILKIGKNVIGRSSAPVEGVSFISIDSHRSAISRMQAFIEIAPNGEAWICDCNSTNGTFLAIRGGMGIRLEPQHYYQLSPNAVITFADVERRFVLLGEDSKPSPAAAAPVITEEAKRLTGNRGSAGEISAPVTGNAETSSNGHLRTAPVVLSNEKQSKPSSPHARSPREVPYLAKPPNAQSETPKSTKPNPSAERDAQTRKRARSLVADEKKVSPKRVKSSTPTERESEGKKGVFLGCVSGMNSKQRGVAQQALKKHHGRIVEDITKANLLIVPAPATRTPKFIIAVGRGIPIIDIKHLEEGLRDGEIQKYIVDLSHLDVYYSSDTLRNAILRKREIPILKGLEFNLGGLSVKQRSTVQEIIIGCGGKATSQKGTSIVEVTDENLNTLYDCILRGQRPELSLKKS